MSAAFALATWHFAVEGIDEGASSAVSSSFVVNCVNDQVWAVGSSAFAEFAVANCSQMSLKPSPLEFMPAGAMPTVGLTTLQVLSKTGIHEHKAYKNMSYTSLV